MVDWQRVDDEHAVLETQGAPPRPGGSAPSPFRAIVAAAESRDWRAVHARLQRLGRAPQGPYEVYLRAESAIAMNDPQASVYIDAVVDPSERDLLRAKWHVTKGDAAKATEALERAFLTMRTNPWTPTALANESLGLTEQLGRTDPAIARRLFDVLAEPFAVEALHVERLATRLRLARIAHDIPRCVTAIAPLEPHFPWNGHLLETRVGCYAKANDPRALPAEEDLRLFLELSGGLVGGLATGPDTPAPAAPPPLVPAHDPESPVVEDASIPDGRAQRAEHAEHD